MSLWDLSLSLSARAEKRWRVILYLKKSFIDIIEKFCLSFDIKKQEWLFNRYFRFLVFLGSLCSADILEIF